MDSLPSIYSSLAGLNGRLHYPLTEHARKEGKELTTQDAKGINGKEY